MIFDNLKNKELYFGVNAKFEKAFEFIHKAIEENMADGKYKIDGKELYAAVSSYKTKEEKVAKFEGHKNYIDIQVIVSGIEKMANTEISNIEPNTEYNSEKDVMFYADKDDVSTLVARSGDFAIFFPTDIHKPGMTFGDIPSEVKKIVVKVRV